MDEMGHADPALALRVDRQAMRRGEDEKTALRRLVEGAAKKRKTKRRPKPEQLALDLRPSGPPLMIA
jgi:hypothetical protein